MRRAGALLLAFTAVAAVGVAPGQAAMRRVRMPYSVLRGLANARDLGRMPASQPMTIGIGLRASHPAGLARFVNDLYDRRSPRYHHFLSPAGFERRFGPSPARFAATLSWLRAGGLQVRQIRGTRDFVLASGSAGRVQRVLSTRLDRFSFQGKSYYANTVAPAVPARLGVLAVTGLNNFEGPRLNRNARPARPDRPQLPHTLGPNTDPGTTSPSDLWSIYDQPSNNKGNGVRMAIFGWGTTNDTLGDLRLFEAEHKFPAMPLSIRYYGGNNEKVTDSGGEVEWDLDTQASTGMAPNAYSETLYFGKSGTDADILAAYNAWAADREGAWQGSSSFGGCEQAPGTDLVGGGPGSPGGTLIPGNPNQDLYEQVLSKVVAEGRTMFASTGDTGAGCPAVSLVLNGVTLLPTPMLNYPAISPHVVGVGGTVLYFNDANGSQSASRAFEYGWTHGGGGSSLFIPAPGYQTSAVTLLGRCLTDSHGNPNVPPPACRGIPDVSAQSGDILTNGYGITEGGSPDQSGGGTSLSSPLWLGMWTRIQAAHPSRLGFANPLLYAQGSKPGMFFDVGGLSTDTAVTCNGPPPVNCSHPGWDYLTGWGSPDVKNLMLAIDGRTAPIRTPPLQPSPTIDIGRLTPCPAPQIADHDGDAPNDYPAGDGSNIDDLDVENASFQTTKDSSGAPALGVTLTVKDLGTGPLPPNMASALWGVYWTAKDANGQEVHYEAQATRDAAGPATQFSFFVQGSDGSGAEVDGTATPGPHGTLHWVIPLSDIGSPATNTMLYETFADTRGSFTVLGTGLQYTAAADRGPDKDFGAVWKIGASC